METTKFQTCPLREYLKYLSEYVNALLVHKDENNQLTNFIRDDMIDFILANKVNIGKEQQVILEGYVHENALQGKIPYEVDLQFNSDRTDRVSRDIFDFSDIKEAIFLEENEKNHQISEAYKDWLNELRSYVTLLHNKPLRKDLLSDFIEFLVGGKMWISTSTLFNELGETIKIMEDKRIVPHHTYFRIFPLDSRLWYLDSLKKNIEDELNQLCHPELKEYAVSKKILKQQVFKTIIATDNDPNLFCSLYHGLVLGMDLKNYMFINRIEGNTDCSYLIVDPKKYLDHQIFIDRLVELIPKMKDGGVILYLRDRDIGVSSIPLEKALEHHNIHMRRISTLGDINTIIKTPVK
jgi:hypothetical protein